MNDPRKRATDELARLLSTSDGLRTARLLQLTEALPSPVAAPARASGRSPAGPRPISIWQPRQRDGATVFERPPPLPLGDHYAHRRTFEQEKDPGTTRICFFGESAAAGYLYAPHLTPAGVLEGLLRNTAADSAFEVIDLARTNETMDSMGATIESSLQLDPDLLVIFTGNNWNLLETPEISPYVPGVRSRQRYALALRRGGLDGPAELARRQIAAKARDLFAAVAKKIPTGVQVIVVIPEVNLADWQDRQPVPWLPADGSGRWHASYAEATGHLTAERPTAALTVADAMLALDGGRCPTTHRLRSLALAALGRTGEARSAAEAEVEAGTYPTLAFLGAPRAGVSTQTLLRRACERHGFTVVDLPHLFAKKLSAEKLAEEAGTSLPGRSLFLDYCHLSSEGIGLAMAAVARSILRLHGASPAPTVDPTLAVEPAVEALARLGAAVHSAHRLLAIDDKRPRLEVWCREALRTDPTIADAMRDLLVARCSPGPEVLTAAQQRNMASPHRLLLQHGWRWDHLDVEVVQALCTALETPTSTAAEAAGHQVRDEIDALLLRSHGVDRHRPGRRGVDLTRPPYLWEPLERFFPEAMARRGLTGRAVYRSPWPESCFCLIADSASKLVLDLTVRLPAIEGTDDRKGAVTVRLNGTEITRVAASERWVRASLDLPRQHLRRAINRITLVWPPLPAAGDEAMAAIIQRLENGVEADLHPIFGEVFSLWVRPAATAI